MSDIESRYRVAWTWQRREDLGGPMKLEDFNDPNFGKVYSPEASDDRPTLWERFQCWLRGKKPPCERGKGS
jgi:hypothetical protein